MLPAPLARTFPRARCLVARRGWAEAWARLGASVLAWLPHPHRSRARVRLPPPVCALLGLQLLLGAGDLAPSPAPPARPGLLCKGEGGGGQLRSAPQESLDTLGSNLSLAVNLFGVWDTFSHSTVPAFTKKYLTPTQC